jgi:hypothetical protein
MPESNRTERRLLDSIRKAKTGNDDQAAPGAASEAGTAGGTGIGEQPTVGTGNRRGPATGADVASASKPANTTRRAKRPAAGKPASTTDDVDTGANAYQSGRRVWPD